MDLEILENEFKCKIPFELMKNDVIKTELSDPLDGIIMPDFKVSITWIPY